MLHLFQTTHQTLNVLKERRALLGRLIDEQMTDIENKALNHYKMQATAINQQEQQLVEAIREVSSHSSDFTNVRNSDILREREVKRRLCQQVKLSVILTELILACVLVKVLSITSFFPHNCLERSWYGSTLDRPWENAKCV